jgi:hypothetical protein
MIRRRSGYAVSNARETASGPFLITCNSTSADSELCQTTGAHWRTGSARANSLPRVGDDAASGQAGLGSNSSRGGCIRTGPKMDEGGQIAHPSDLGSFPSNTGLDQLRIAGHRKRVDRHRRFNPQTSLRKLLLRWHSVTELQKGRRRSES